MSVVPYDKQGNNESLMWMKISFRDEEKEEKEKKKMRKCNHKSHKKFHIIMITIFIGFFHDFSKLKK